MYVCSSIEDYVKIISLLASETRFLQVVAHMWRAVVSLRLIFTNYQTFKNIIIMPFMLRIRVIRFGTDQWTLNHDHVEKDCVTINFSLREWRQEE